MKRLTCIHCGMELTDAIWGGLYQHANRLQRCKGGPNGSVPYGHMGHPSMPCPPGTVNPCAGYLEGDCTHVDSSPPDSGREADRG